MLIRLPPQTPTITTTTTTNTSSIKKRRAAQDSNTSDSPQTPTSEHARKKARPNPRFRHTLDHFTFVGPSINHLEPPSPLFFSNSPRQRPHLPPRFSSSEAGATMLSKANSEESHVKTVTLARGNVSTPTVPTSNPTLRRSVERSSTTSAPRSSSPDTTLKGDVSPASLASIGITELLNQDERPTIIIDLGDSTNYGVGPLRPLFANASMRSYQGLVDVVSGLAEDDASPGLSTGKSFVQFKSWLLSAAVNGESLNVCLPSFLYAGMCWSCSTLRKRLRIISGTYSNDATQRNSLSGPAASSVLSRSAASQSNPPTSARSLLSAAKQDEPQDYFGSAAPSTSADTVSPATASDHVLPSSEPIDKQSAMQRGQATSLATSRKAPPPASADAAMLDLYPSLAHESMLSAQTAGNVDWFSGSSTDITEGPSFDWTRVPVTDTTPLHIQFARSVEWTKTALGPIESWSADLRQMCNLIMASPHPAAMYWGEDLIAIYNEAYVLLAGQKHPKLMGQSYKEAWKEIWPDVEGVFANAVETGEATMKDDDRLFMLRNDYLEETYFSWSIIPMVGGDGSVMGLYNPAFEKTRRKLAERRMLTLREIGERTASARDVKGFWNEVLAALRLNEYDVP